MWEQPSTRTPPHTVRSPLPRGHESSTTTWSHSGSWSSPCPNPNLHQARQAMCVLRGGGVVGGQNQSFITQMRRAWFSLRWWLTFKDKDREDDPHAQATYCKMRRKIDGINNSTARAQLKHRGGVIMFDPVWRSGYRRDVLKLGIIYLSEQTRNIFFLFLRSTMSRMFFFQLIFFDCH